LAIQTTIYFYNDFPARMAPASIIHPTF